jgi:phosphatidylglycerophosphate synthase
VLAALRGEVSGSFLLAPYDVVTTPETYRKLQTEADTTALASLAAAAGQPIGPLRADTALLDALPDTSDDQASLEQLRDEGRVELVDVAPHWWASVRSQQGRRKAVWHLFEACRKPVDGFVSRHLNRHVSIFISKLVVNTPLSPNGATILTFLVGVAAAGFALSGSYGDTLIAAALFQLNQILDGVDGELARVRHQQSKLGQWLDTIGDDAALALFYGALAIGARSQPGGQWLSASGWIVAATTVLAAVLYYTELIRVGSGDLYAIEWSFDQRPAVRLRDKVVLFFRTIFKQDFFSFVFLCAAALGVLHQALPMFATGGVIIVTAAAIRRIGQRKRA